MPVRGFTLVELVVAVTLLAVGVLAVAASAVPLAMLARRGWAEASAATAARAAIEAARSAGCGASAAGMASSPGLKLSWIVTGSGALREMTVVTTYPWGPGAHSDTFVAAIPCPG